jgi:hypothetical protein
MSSQSRGEKQKVSKKNRGRAPKHVAPRNANEYYSRPEEFQDRWNRVTHVISKMRKDRTSLQQASQEFGLSPQTVIRWGKSALRRRTNGQYAAKASDRLLRVLVIPTRHGVREIAIRDSRQASEIGGYWHAVQRYLETGDSFTLRQYRGAEIKDASGTKLLLIADLDELSRLASAGALSFESMYAKAA